MRAWFARQQKAALAALHRDHEKLAKLSAEDDALIQRALAGEPLTDEEKVQLEQALKSLHEDSGRLAIDGLAARLPNDADVEAMLSLASDDAIAYARERAAELVTRVDETTRQGIQDLVVDAQREGWTVDELGNAIADMYGFSDERGVLIARTETSYADNRGTLSGWKATGQVEGKQWLADPSNPCDDCGELDGETVPIDDDFPNDGGDGPPLHPNCECTILAVLSAEGEDNSE